VRFGLVEFLRIVYPVHAIDKFTVNLKISGKFKNFKDFRSYSPRFKVIMVIYFFLNYLFYKYLSVNVKCIIKYSSVNVKRNIKYSSVNIKRIIKYSSVNVKRIIKYSSVNVKRIIQYKHIVKKEIKG